MMSCIRKGLLAALVVALFAANSQACWYPCGCICWYPCWPCWPCCQPDTTPLNPQPPHPPHGPTSVKLNLVNTIYPFGFADISVYDSRWGGFDEYERIPVNFSPNPTAAKQQYYQGDLLLIQTWVRNYPWECWYCRCSTLVRLTGATNTFNIVSCWFTVKDTKSDASAGTGSATIVVDLPEDARLTIDDQPTESTSGRRVFTTPDLEEGKEYSYTLKAEVVRDGRVQVITKEVAFRAGEETQVELELPTLSVAAR